MCSLYTNGKMIFGLVDKLQVKVHPYLEYFALMISVSFIAVIFFIENKLKLHLINNWAQFRAESNLGSAA